VPGVFFCNREIGPDNPHISDIGPTVLELFGIDVPTNMTGRPLITEDLYDEYEGGDDR
jgi:bisphosphoglycerate-independent phosphoglycerate mutase (AlkP superfamily)